MKCLNGFNVSVVPSADGTITLTVIDVENALGLNARLTATQVGLLVGMLRAGVNTPRSREPKVYRCETDGGSAVDLAVVEPIPSYDSAVE